MPIYFDQNLPNAKHLVAIRRKKPAIVVLNKYHLGSNREHYCFHVIFLSGCWRSDEEIKSNCDSYEKAANYHGVFADQNYSEIDQFFKSYIEYMVKSNRYHPGEIARNIIMIQQSSNTLDIDKILDESFNQIPQRISQIRQSLIQFNSINPELSQTESIENDDSNDINELIGLNYEFHSAIGARVMLMRNIDIKKKLINGARGTIVGYVSNENEDLSQIFAIKIKFDFQEFNEPPIDVTRKIVNIYQMMNGECFTIYQFPLRLAWAVTAHKAQGQTLDKVSIDIGCQAFAHGAFYVALSRVRKLEDVLFFGSRRWPENGITFHINDYIQQQTRAIIDEAEHVFARNAPNADGNGHNEEEDFLINELSDEDMVDDDSTEDEENMTYNSIN